MQNLDLACVWVSEKMTWHFIELITFKFAFRSKVNASMNGVVFNFHDCNDFMVETTFKSGTKAKSPYAAQIKVSLMHTSTLPQIQIQTHRHTHTSAHRTHIYMHVFTTTSF